MIPPIPMMHNENRTFFAQNHFSFLFDYFLYEVLNLGSFAQLVQQNVTHHQDHLGKVQI